jgi:exosome complex component RRP42
LLVISVGDNIFFDPTHAELAVADAVLAVTVAASSSSSSLNLLAVRTIDPPSRLSSPAAEAGMAGSGVAAGGAGEEGLWRPKKGGMNRRLLARMVGMCVEGGGVGEEVLQGLEGFTT